MRTEFFLVADAVEIYADGKCVIVGTFDTITARQFPLPFRHFGMALKLWPGKAERRKDVELRLVLQKRGSSKSIIELAFTIPFRDGEDGRPRPAVFAATIGNARFETPGKYYVRIKKAEQNVTVCQVAMTLCQAPPSPAAEATPRQPKKAKRKKKAPAVQGEKAGAC